MTVSISPELAAYMARRHRRILSVEVASADHSDIEVTELYVRLVRDDFADYLVDRKHYRRVPAGEYEVLLPNYRLHYDEELRFGLKSFWFFHHITLEGVRL